MIYIVSAGRSGSGWLSTVFTALGLRGTHEGHPHTDDSHLDFISDTSWLWSGTELISRLGFRNRLKIRDVVILLHRPKEEIEHSVAKLIGKTKDWDKLFESWENLKTSFFSTGITQILRATYNIQYVDLFRPSMKATLRSILANADQHDKMDSVDRVWDFMQHMRVTNKTGEDEVRATHQPTRNQL